MTRTKKQKHTEEEDKRHKDGGKKGDKREEGIVGAGCLPHKKGVQVSLYHVNIGFYPWRLVIRDDTPQHRRTLSKPIYWGLPGDSQLNKECAENDGKLGFNKIENHLLKGQRESVPLFGFLINAVIF